MFNATFIIFIKMLLICRCILYNSYGLGPMQNFNIGLDQVDGSGIDPVLVWNPGIGLAVAVLSC